ncbi:MAG: TOMM precursor leader peptide-binding protein, partial [Nonomuraea sp.]|nr:TOMM precursor leader peptide-binding protein [Nonomuraea sp.]
VALGDVRAEWFTGAARAAGLRIGHDEPPALRVVLTDDYLRPELRDFDLSTPWLLVKPVGVTTWAGPIFEDGVTGCYECLHVRLASKNMLTSYLKQRDALPDGLQVASITDTPASVGLAARLAALHAAKWVTGVFRADRERRARYGEVPGLPPIEQAEVITIDGFSLDVRHHAAPRRPQCPRCGDPGLQSAQHRRPVTPVSRPKAAVTDGGHRARDPQEFLDAHAHLISPVTGTISNLIKMPLKVEGLHAYTAGQNFAIPMRDAADLRAGLRSMSSGKGMSDVQARASAVGEAIERYSVLFHGDEERVTASYNELGPETAIAPNDVNLYSDRQFADRAAWNARPSHFHRVAVPFDPDARIEWTPMWSLTHGRQRYFPTSGLFFSYPNRPELMFTGADSNGCAAGTSLEDAILQGFMELVERDTVAMWWYNRLRRPAIDLSGFGVPYFTHWQEWYRSLNRETWVLDLTNDLGIPSVVAVSYRVDKPVEDILFSFGAHFDVKVAIGRALSEMNQFLTAVIGVGADGSGSYAFDDPDQLHWWRTARLAEQSYLLPAEDVPARTAADFTDPTGADLLGDIDLARRVVEAKGLEMLVLDHTRPDIGLPVVKVMVPGLRHFWPRYAPGRLYDVPVELGWLDRPATEDELNPIAMFL